jgi:hypothetical protein
MDPSLAFYLAVFLGGSLLCCRPLSLTPGHPWKAAHFPCFRKLNTSVILHELCS